MREKVDKKSSIEIQLKTLDLSSFPLLRIDQLKMHATETLIQSEKALSSLIQSYTDDPLAEFSSKLIEMIRKEIATRRIEELLLTSGENSIGEPLQNKEIHTEEFAVIDPSHKALCSPRVWKYVRTTPWDQCDGMASSTKESERIDKSGDVLTPESSLRSELNALCYVNARNDAKSTKREKGGKRNRKSITENITNIHQTNPDAPTYFISSGSRKSNGGGFLARARAVSVSLKLRADSNSQDSKQTISENEKKQRRKMALERMQIRRARKEENMKSKNKHRLKQKRKREEYRRPPDRTKKEDIKRTESHSSVKERREQSQEAILVAADADSTHMTNADLEDSDSEFTLSDTNENSSDSLALELGYRAEDYISTRDCSLSANIGSKDFKTCEVEKKKVENDEQKNNEIPISIEPSQGNLVGLKDRCHQTVDTCANADVLEDIKLQKITNSLLSDVVARPCSEEKNTTRKYFIMHDEKNKEFCQRVIGHACDSQLQRHIDDKDCSTVFTQKVQVSEIYSCNFGDKLKIEQTNNKTMRRYSSDSCHSEVIRDEVPTSHVEEIPNLHKKRKEPQKSKTSKANKGKVGAYMFSNLFPNFWNIFTAFINNSSTHNIQDIRECLDHQIKLNHGCLADMEDTSIANPNDSEYRREDFASEVFKKQITKVVLRDPCSIQKGLFYRTNSIRSEVTSIVTDVLESDMVPHQWRNSLQYLGVGNNWNLLWTWSQPRINTNHLLVCQKISRFENSKYLTRKDYLKKKIQSFCSIGNSKTYMTSPEMSKVTKPRIKSHQTDFAFNIMPLTYILPTEYNAFVAAFSSVQNIAGNKASNLWIMKPVGLSRGRGIFLVNDICQVSYSTPTVIQRYLSNPLLFHGFKFDLRLYVAVVSFNPLEAYIHKEGLARFSSKKFTLCSDHIDDIQIHLTNSSIQKNYWDDLQSSHPVRLAGPNGGGNKVRLSWLWKQLKQEGLDTCSIWKRISALCLKTLICVDDEIPFQPNAFEVFGFDVMIDDNLRPWLIEVNSCPSLCRETSLDADVKETVISDTISLIEPLAFDRNSLLRICKRRLHEKKKASNHCLSEKDQLEKDLKEIFMDKLPRQYGESPTRQGGHERLAPNTKLFQRIMKQRGRTIP